MAKFAVSMPDSVLAEVEKARKQSGESRSEFLRRAAETVIREDQERDWDRQYIEGYRRMPETEEDHPFLAASLRAVLEDNPWDERERQRVAKR